MVYVTLICAAKLGPICYENIILVLLLIPTTWEIQILYMSSVIPTIKISKLFMVSTLTAMRDKIGLYRYSKMEVLAYEEIDQL